MRILAWIAGIVGIVVALYAIIGGMRGPFVTLMGRDHAPSTFISLGVFVLAVGIWLGVVGLYSKK